MIKKRVSKKLLAGLGASIAFSTTAFISGLGVKAIINSVNNDVPELRFNRINEADFSRISNLSTPTRNMFFDTTRLGNFHAGTVRKGQTLTPWGWLGIYHEDNQGSGTTLKKKLALTGWNGEILWVNDDFPGQFFNDNKADIFDIKYDWNNDWIFLARSQNSSGLFNPVANAALNSHSLTIDVLDAKTGIRLTRVDGLENFASAAANTLKNNFFDANKDLTLDSIGGINRITDLYSLDITSFAGSQNEALGFYMPNFMQLYQKSAVNSSTTGTLPNFAKVLEAFKLVSRGWIIEGNGTGAGFKTRSVDPTMSSEISGQNWNFTDQTTNTPMQLNTNDFYLLANPFWTATDQSHKFVLHFFIANSDGDVYHKIIGFQLDAPQSQNNNVIAEFDKTEKVSSVNNISNNILDIKLKSNQWGNNANTWNVNFINANLRINKNMFDNNIVTFAFPVAASQNNSGNFPIFDIAQIKINARGLVDNSNNKNQLSSRIFNLGNQILDTNKQINPWPDIKSNKTSLTHNYNRLISVSPFDNTFIYNAMPNLQGVNNSSYNADDMLNKFLNFWIVNAITGQFKPFVISNDTTLKGTIPNTIINVEKLLQEGFTFDLGSLDSNRSINLYFNHSGTERNDWYDSPPIENLGMRSAKIGLLDDIFSLSTSQWTNSITNPISNGSNQIVQINNESFATLIHSRADMTKWYARTQFNLDNPGNLWTANQQINQTTTSSTRVKANVFNAAISDSNVKTKEGVDLVSHWQIGQGKYNGNTTNRLNYDRLVVKRPAIRTANNSNPQTLGIATSYDFDNKISSKYETLFNLNSDSKNRLTFKTNQQITNASWQIFSSWNKV